MKYFLIIFLAASIVWAGSLVSAAAEEPLAWPACVQEALARHPDLAAKQQSVRQAEAAWVTSRSSLLPQLDADLNARWARSEPSASSQSFDYGLSLQQMLFDGFKSWRGLDQSELNRQAALWDYSDASADVRQRLRTAFVELLRAQALQILARNIIQRRQQNLELVRLRYEAGREHQGSLLLAEAQVTQAQADGRQAERNLLQAQYGLDRELGLAAFAPVAVQGEFALGPVDAVRPDFASLVRRNPRWQYLHTQTESARLGWEISRSAWYPNLYANASADRSGGSWPPDQNNYSAGLSLNWPLFTGGRRLGESERTQAAYVQAQAVERSGQDLLLASLVDAWAAYQDSADGVEVKRRFLTAAEERSRIGEAQYSTGLLAFDNWIIIEDDLVQSQKAYLDAQAQALRDQAGWIRAQGGVLENER